jgi:L-amino acid N-acyltransferase YncA
MTSMIRSATPDDAAAIAAIYNHYILHTWVTFEEEPVAAEEMQRRIADITVTYPWLVYEQNGVVEGYAYVHQWHTRKSYRRSVETTIYLDVNKLGGGRGTQLYAELLRQIREAGLHCAIGGVSLPNQGSVALHEKFGFTKVAHYKEVGWKFDTWIDVAYWQLML